MTSPVFARTRPGEIEQARRWYGTGTGKVIFHPLIVITPMIDSVRRAGFSTTIRAGKTGIPVTDYV